MEWAPSGKKKKVENNHASIITKLCVKLSCDCSEVFALTICHQQLKNVHYKNHSVIYLPFLSKEV